MKTKSFQIFFSGVALLLLATMFACNKNEPQGAKIENISFKQKVYSISESQTDGMKLKSELVIAPAAIADTCKITWTVSNTEVASISNEGVLTPKKPGETAVTATVQGMAAMCSVTVKEIEVTKINLENVEVEVGGEVALKYTTEPAMVPVERIKFTSADINIAIVSEGNTVVGVADGETTITAKCGAVEATCNVKVGKGIIPVKSVKVIPTSYSDDFVMGATKKLEIEVDPVDAQYDKVLWESSNKSVATVSEDGTVTCKGEGTSTITATVNGVKGTCKATYSKAIIHVTSVSVSPASYADDAIVGSTKQLTATVKPDNATEKTVTWSSSNTSVATVSSTGVVTCKGVGTATIKASCDGKSGSCSVTFRKIPVTSVTISPSSWKGQARVGVTKQLTATVKPDNATVKTVTWSSSNKSVATVTNTGNVVSTGVVGTTTITATCDGKTSTSTITFEKVPVSSITISPSSYTVDTNVGATKQLTATVNPDYATYKTVTWSSSNTSIVTVNNNGLITCKGPGMAYVTATADGHSQQCWITYNVVRVTQVIMSRTSARIINTGGESVGGAVRLSATVKPDNATYKSVSWTSSNDKVATVDQNGFVIGRSEGTATIYATNNGISATCTVTVQSARYITDCQSNSYLTVKIGDQWWMTENLMCTQYDTESERKNEYINEYKSSMSELEPHFISDVYKNWESTTFSGNLSDKQKLKLGLLYSWSAAVGLSASDALKRKSEFSSKRQGICPNGWYIPKKSDWLTLREYAGGESTCGKKLKSSSGWYSKNGEDYYFFEGLPSGRGEYGKISYVGASAYYWSASPSTSDNAYAWAATMTYVDDKLNIYEDAGVPNFKRYEMGVRCVKND